LALTLNNNGNVANEPGVRELIAESVKSALDRIFASNFFHRIAANNSGMAAGGKSVELLNGEGKYNALTWLGVTVQDEVSDMLKILDSTEHETVKFNQLKACLENMQWKNQFMQFTLQRDTVREFMRHQFDSAPSETNMMKGFTPFCLQKMDEACEINLEQPEQYHEGASNLMSSDLRNRDSALKFAQIQNPLDFLAVKSNTHALAKVYLCCHPCSPLDCANSKKQWYGGISMTSSTSFLHSNRVGLSMYCGRCMMDANNQQDAKGKRLLDDSDGGGKYKHHSVQCRLCQVFFLKVQMLEHATVK